VNRVGGLDRGTLYGPLRRVGFVAGSVGTKVSQIGGNGVCLFALSEACEAGERSVVRAVVSGEM
jgi:hypothetical protein